MWRLYINYSVGITFNGVLQVWYGIARIRIALNGLVYFLHLGEVVRLKGIKTTSNYTNELKDTSSNNRK